jgi:5,10-methylenetetrahydromethanopterin reductase
MSRIEFFKSALSIPLEAADAAQRAEAEGWTGLTFNDSQNLSGDPYVALTLAASATTRLRIAPGVTNPFTRHPATTASAITCVDLVSDGRAELGIGRGDSCLAYIGLAPAPVSRLASYLDSLRKYLRGDGISMAEASESAAHQIGSRRLPLLDAPDESRLEWLRANYPGRAPVPVYVASSGERVIRMAAERADRVTLAVGANPGRVKWAIDLARSVNPKARFGAYVNLLVDEEIDRGVKVAAGVMTLFARFSVMHGSVSGPMDDNERSVFEQLSTSYQMTHHGQGQNQAATELARSLADGFGIIGPGPYCRDRLTELAELGVDRFHIMGASHDVDRETAESYNQAFVSQILTSEIAA